MSKPAVVEQIPSEYQALLNGVAEELKTPLLYIARRAELALLTEETSSESLRSVRMSAVAGLELIDSYLLGLQLAERQQALDLEPVSPASTLYDVAQTLGDIAKQRDVTLRLDVQGAHTLVMANRPALIAALVSLSTVFIDAQSPAEQRPVVTLAAYQTRRGLATGVYSDSQVISSTDLRRAYALHSAGSRQPLNQLSATSAAGLFVARNIFQAMAAELRAVRHHKQAGVAAFLQPSQQLQFI